MCDICDCDLYAMYADDDFRQEVGGHVCVRDSILWLAEELKRKSTKNGTQVQRGKMAVQFDMSDLEEDKIDTTTERSLE